MKWGKYLQVNTLTEDIDKSLKQHSNRINSLISNVSQEIIDSNVANQKEINRVLQRDFDDIVDSIDSIGEGIESLHAAFNFAIGQVLWKLEMCHKALAEILQEVRLAEFEREARSFRTRAEDAYKNGWYQESLSDFLEAEKRNYQDFAVLFSIANIYLYNNTEYEDNDSEPSLEKALVYYLKSAKYSTPKSKKHAAKSYLFSGWTCYLLKKDNDALDYTSKALELNPDLTEAYFQKAKILMCLDSPDKALVPLRKAIEIDRDYSIKACMDEDFKRYDKAVQGLLDKMRTEAQKAAQEALDSVNTKAEKINRLGIGRYYLQDYARNERKIITSEITKATHSFRNGTLYGYLDSETFSTKTSVALFHAVAAFAKEAIKDAKNKLLIHKKELSDIQSGWFGKSAKLKELESKVFELQKAILELKSLGNDHLNLIYRKLSVSQVQSISNISIRKKEDWGFYGHSTINHKYDLKSINGDKVVIDHATDLMWHQSGSNNFMNWNKAKDWLRSMNSKGYAGYHDWRLPTLEEAAALLESSEKNGLYIDPLFSNKQRYIWTDDKCGSDGALSVYFNHGNVGWNSSFFYDGYVRPVRCGK